jgi:hypothetical protein
MKKILTILRNQPTDSSDQQLINTLRDEAKRERLNDSQKIDFKIESINQERPNIFQESKSRRKASQLKLIYAFGFTCLMITLLALIPQSKLRLLLPGEREKLDMQLQVWNEIGELKEEIETSLLQHNEKLKIYNLENLEIEWQDHLPGYEALISIAEIKNELLRISPFENIRVPVNSDLQFLYQTEWDIIKESILTLGSES